MISSYNVAIFNVHCTYIAICVLLAPSPPEIMFPAKHRDNNSTETQASAVAGRQKSGWLGIAVAVLTFRLS